MGKMKGFRIKKHLLRFSNMIYRRPRSDSGYRRLAVDAPSSCRSKTLSKVLAWGRQLSTKTRRLCSSGYVPVGREPMQEAVTVPKGHLAVYVGQNDGDSRRVLVPVIYFNHPLFGELLRGVEEEYGFNQQGGLTIPCGLSEFERVKTRIAAGCGGRRMMTWKKHL